MATLEARVMRACHVMLVNATKTCCTSVAGDLFQEYLITDDVKTAMSLNIPDQEKAEKLIDCVRAQVASTPEKINVFIKVLGRNSMEDAVKKLEEQILLLKEKETNAIDQPRVEVKSKPKKEIDAIDLPGAEAQPKINQLNLQLDRLTTNQKDDLLTKLMDDFDMIKQEFAGLVDSTLQSLQQNNVTLEELKVAVKMYLPNKVHNLFSSTKSLNDMFLEDLSDYWSFFDYELLAFIIKRRCKELQSDLDGYIAIFKEYCKRKYSEVPTAFNSKARERYFKLTVKVYGEFDHITMEQVKEIECQLKKITGLDLSLSRIGDGCIELVFISLSEEDDMLPLSTQDKEKLSEMGVFKLYSSNCVYYDSDISSPNGAQISPPLPNPNISQQEIKLITDAVKESDKVGDLAAALEMSDCLEDAGGDVGVLLQQWQEKADSSNIRKRSHLLYHIARIGMQDLHENLVTQETQLLIDMQSELDSLRSVYQQTIEENEQLKDELQQEKYQPASQESKIEMQEKKIRKKNPFKFKLPFSYTYKKEPSSESEYKKEPSSESEYKKEPSSESEYKKSEYKKSSSSFSSSFSSSEEWEQDSAASAASSAASASEYFHESDPRRYDEDFEAHSSSRLTWEESQAMVLDKDYQGRSSRPTRGEKQSHEGSKAPSPLKVAQKSQAQVHEDSQDQ